MYLSTLINCFIVAFRFFYMSTSTVSPSISYTIALSKASDESSKHYLTPPACPIHSRS